MAGYRYECWGEDFYIVYKVENKPDGTCGYYQNVIGQGWKENPEVIEEFWDSTFSHYCSEEEAMKIIEIMQKIYVVKDGKVVKREAERI